MSIRAKLFLTVLLLALVPSFAHAQLETKPTPMWEGLEKSELDAKNDEKLIASALKITNGDRRAASTAMLRIGWGQINEGKANDAIRSFNQAWLIEPEFSDVHWAFAVATHIRGDDLSKVERHFDRAAKGNENDPRLATDRGRVLETRKLPEKAKIWFERAIEMDATYIPAYVGMIQVAQALGDETLEAKYQEKHDELTGKTE